MKKKFPEILLISDIRDINIINTDKTIIVPESILKLNKKVFKKWLNYKKCCEYYGSCN